ncbi:hypothetical protein [Streptomyces qinzhouensis]|uniref:Uncharacterized protein n=1 Tax=Streptomyces qinzhouensis TaxID=2599401 RepID=A0A5B8IBI1_9ACTN|nr:hypothetical protein [Streptomyces qinzhouensis]QDY75428.1 hypothetical protein FQU76_01680 [Streptomyces qinzhouensis]
MTALTRTQPAPAEAERVFHLVRRAAGLTDVKAEVEANHDDNRWWPTSITDPRVRMAVAGWSSRVSYRMIGTYSRVVSEAASIGFDGLVAASDDELAELLTPLGLVGSRVGYFRSLTDLLLRWEKESIDPTTDGADCDALITIFAQEVRGASYKVAQCALLYARGYHCGIIPVDSGMVTKLAPALGISLPSGPVAHERFRYLLEAVAEDRADDLRALARSSEYAVSIPEQSAPSWWTHLVLIYFKRLYLNGPSPRLCPLRPLCGDVVDCSHARSAPDG